MKNRISKNLKPSVPASHQAGLSLIELMIALLISTLLVFGMVTIFLSGKSSFMAQEQTARLQENGRFAFQIMSAEIQEAGFHDEVWDPPRVGFAFTNATIDGGSNPDVIEVQYESDRDCFDEFNTVTENVVTPNGTVEVPSFYHKLVTFTIVTNVGTGDAQLNYRCQYGPIGGALTEQLNVAIADGVEDMQIQYGEDLTNDLSVNRWVNAGAWGNNGADVVSIRMALLVRSPEAFLDATGTTTHDMYSYEATGADDRRHRKVFAGQINLRNLTL